MHSCQQPSHASPCITYQWWGTLVPSHSGMHFQQVWNSDTSEVARRQVLSELASEEPDLRLLYTTPESLRNPTLRSYLQVSLKVMSILAS